MKISVIIPIFNSSKTISRALSSVISQTQSPYEIILIDDCSTDNSLKELKEIQKKTSSITIKIIQNHKNSGPAYSRNRGINESKGDWIAFLDDDDYWHPQKLEIQSQVASSCNINFVGTKSSLSPNNNLYKSTEITVQTLKPFNFLWKNHFQTPTVLVKKNYILKFNENMRHSEDYDLWMKLIHHHKKAAYIEQPLTYLGKPPFLISGLSSNLIKMEIGELKVLSTEKNLFLRIFSLTFSILKFCKRIIFKFFWN